MLEKILLLFFLYLPFQIALNPLEGIDLASIRIIIPLIFLLWLLQGLKNKKIFIPFNLVTILIISFLLLNIFSLFFAGNIHWGIRKLLFLLSIFPLYFIISDLFLRTKDLSLKLLKFLVWGSGLSAIIGLLQFIAQFFFGIDKVYSFWSRIIIPFLGNSFAEAVLENPSWLVNISGHTLLRATAFFPDPHMFAFYLGITAPISLSLYIFKPSTFRHFGFLFLIILLADILTFSRGGYLGLLIGLLFFAIFFLRQKGFLPFYSYQMVSSKKTSAKNIPVKKLFFLKLILIFMILFFIIPNPATQRLFSSFNLNEGSNVDRLQTWHQSITVILNNPILGVGLGNYASTIKPSAEYREPIYSHNAFFDIASETGIPNALIWLLILIISILKTTRKFLQHNNILYLGIASGLIVFSIHSLFETAIFSVHILPLIILLISLTPRQNNEKTF